MQIANQSRARAFPIEGGPRLHPGGRAPGAGLVGCGRLQPSHVRIASQSVVFLLCALHSSSHYEPEDSRGWGLNPSQAAKSNDWTRPGILYASSASKARASSVRGALRARAAPRSMGRIASWPPVGAHSLNGKSGEEPRTCMEWVTSCVVQALAS